MRRTSACSCLSGPADQGLAAKGPGAELDELAGQLSVSRYRFSFAGPLLALMSGLTEFLLLR